MVGSTEKLGKWEKLEAHMTWEEGDFWVLKDFEVPASEGVFTYKYVVLNNGKPERWEKGLNRIADLKLMSIQNGGSSKLQFNDIFNMYSVRFNMLHSLSGSEHLKIVGDTEQLGLWQEGDGP